MQNTINLHLAYRGTRQRGEHDSSKGIAESQTIASLKRFTHESAKLFVIGDLSNLNVWFFKIEQE